MRACMWSLFAKPLAALAPDPRLQSGALLEQRLSVAKLASALTKASRTRYTLIPASVQLKMSNRDFSKTARRNTYF